MQERTDLKYLLMLIQNCQLLLLLLRSDLRHLTCLSFFHLCDDIQILCDVIIKFIFKSSGET